jgi:hypothetical protein
VPVASYVRGKWRAWLQNKRIELNALDVIGFLQWLDAGIKAHDSGKVIPPGRVMRKALKGGVKRSLRHSITHRILTEAGIDDLVARALDDRAGAVEQAAATITDNVGIALAEPPQERWSAPVGRIARAIAETEEGS